MSGSPSFRLTPNASADIRSILRFTRRHFGAGQHASYSALLTSAARLVAAAPDRPGSTDQSHLLPGLRAFPVWLAARRRSAAAHVLMYRRAADGIEIVRVLHERMDPARHLAPSPDDPR